jgi:hypothetical protein
MLFCAILATKSIVKVHVHPDDSGRNQFPKKVSREMIRNVSCERSRKDTGMELVSPLTQL